MDATTDRQADNRVIELARSGRSGWAPLRSAGLRELIGPLGRAVIVRDPDARHRYRRLLGQARQRARQSVLDARSGL